MKGKLFLITINANIQNMEKKKKEKKKANERGEPSTIFLVPSLCVCHISIYCKYKLL